MLLWRSSVYFVLAVGHIVGCPLHQIVAVEGVGRWYAAGTVGPVDKGGGAGGARWTIEKLGTTKMTSICLFVSVEEGKWREMYTCIFVRHGRVAYS